MINFMCCPNFVPMIMHAITMMLSLCLIVMVTYYYANADGDYCPLLVITIMIRVTIMRSFGNGRMDFYGFCLYLLKN